MAAVQLELISYDDSLFTNAHDLVSPLPVHDGRGTFSHLGVKMEGLESSRHWNVKSASAAGTLEFWRDHTVVNRIELLVRGPSSRVLIQALEFDTAFYTKNPTKDVYEVTLIDDLDGSSCTVVKHLALKGDAKHAETLTTAVAASRVILKVGEGGLSRFKVFGTALPPLPALTSLSTCVAYYLACVTLLDSDAKPFGVSDASYGDPSLVLRPKREGTVMAGWESCRHSARHRLGLQLAKPGHVKRLEIDTYMHCCNPFRFIAVLALNETNKHATPQQLLDSLPAWHVTSPDGKEEAVTDGAVNDYLEKHGGMSANGPVKYHLDLAHYHGPWKLLLPFSPLKRDTLHEFMKTLHDVGEVTHLMFFGVPDGGIHRIGVYGDTK